MDVDVDGDVDGQRGWDGDWTWVGESNSIECGTRRGMAPASIARGL